MGCNDHATLRIIIIIDGNKKEMNLLYNYGQIITAKIQAYAVN